MTVHSLWADDITSPLPHINRLELLAVLLALRSFASVLQGHSVAIMSDNTMTICYISHQGGTVSCSFCKLALQLWDFCLENDTTPTATHVPGVDNSLVDTLSRDLTACHEWELNNLYLDPIFRLWRYPTLDAFALITNTKCSLYCSRGNRVVDSVGDGLIFNWSSHLVYAFQPLPLISNALQKILAHPTWVFLVTPWWPHQPWFPLLLRLSQRTFYKFLPHPDLLILRTVKRDSPPSSQHPVAGTDNLGHLSLRFSARTQDTIRNSRKPSSRLSYERKWNCFLRWLPLTSPPPSSAGLPVVFNFLLHLADAGLSLSSLKVYLSVISAYHTEVDGHSVFSHPLAKRFMRGLLLTQLPDRQLCEAWDLPLVLCCLTHHPFEPAGTCELRLLSLKTLFLVAITSAHRVG